MLRAADTSANGEQEIRSAFGDQLMWPRLAQFGDAKALLSAKGDAGFPRQNPENRLQSCCKVLGQWTCPGNGRSRAFSFGAFNGNH
mmetsp:Transcript_37201/g.88814  ORF Transcript_37201/g.88814 Transcript_37201/m.88814 type:complete len:86 (-) Transcript_37201:60-317(-)